MRRQESSSKAKLLEILFGSNVSLKSSFSVLFFLKLDGHFNLIKEQLEVITVR